MKVLILNETAGSSRYWGSAIPLLRSRGIDVSFVSLRGTGPITEVLEGQGIPTSALGAGSSLDYPKAVSKLVKIIKKEGFHIVHASESLPAAVAGTACAFGGKTKCIFHYHHTRSAGVQRTLSMVGSKLSDMVMAVSESSREATIANDRTPRQKTFVAYNGINALRSVSDDETRDLRRSLEIPDGAKVMTIVGRLGKGKGHTTLFEACRIAAATLRQPLHLIVVGDGEEMSALKSAASHQSHFKIHFVGHKDDVALYYAAADVVANPSYHESFGLAAVEAMSCGKAVVASDIEGLAEIIENGTSGLLVPAGDASALADAILSVFDDAEFGARLGENARARVGQKFTMDKMVGSWIECYKAILS
ncbi:MAG: glycosyltransferase family 4 protein [Pyrinomonadaceae bacterium]